MESMESETEIQKSENDNTGGGNASNAVSSHQNHFSEIGDTDKKEVRRVRIRNLVGFWIFGLTNNFAYSIMLSAAHDILKDPDAHKNQTYENTTISPSLEPSQNSSKLIPFCSLVGTGAILLADILPGLIMKLTGPFYVQYIYYKIRVIIVALLAATSLIIVAISQTIWFSLLGVACASISGGLGEITFLGLASHFEKNSISTWSSGTGGAGIFSALCYAGMTSVGITPRTTLFIMLFIPVLMLIGYFVIIVKPSTVDSKPDTMLIHDSDEQEEYNEAMEKGKHIALKIKVLLILPLLKWMIPLALVYVAEYFINQGLSELVAIPGAYLFPGVPLSVSEQYRWFQVDYQLGVFMSRSSVNLFKVNKLWILPILQFANVAVILFQIFYKFIPTIWILLIVILFEGLLGGCAYVNTFYKILTEVDVDKREFSVGVASISDSFGIAIAAAVSVPVHNLLCSLPA